MDLKRNAETLSIMSCSTRYTSPLDVCIMTQARTAQMGFDTIFQKPFYEFVRAKEIPSQSTLITMIIVSLTFILKKKSEQNTELPDAFSTI